MDKEPTIGSADIARELGERIYAVKLQRWARSGALKVDPDCLPVCTGRDYRFPASELDVIRAAVPLMNELGIASTKALQLAREIVETGVARVGPYELRAA